MTGLLCMVHGVPIFGKIKKWELEMCEEYNGWVNRETWAMALHLSNDEGLYMTCVDLVGDDPMRGAQSIESSVTDWFDWVLCENDAPEWIRNMVADVGSLYRVDWLAVAKSFVES
jgi:hypothetical protein